MILPQVIGECFAALYSEIIIYENPGNVNSIVQVCLNTNKILLAWRYVLAMADLHSVSNVCIIFQTWYASWLVKFKCVTVNVYVSFCGIDITATFHAF